MTESRPLPNHEIIDLEGIEALQIGRQLPRPSRMELRAETVECADAWESEYDRDIWRLRDLGIKHHVAHILFDAIPQQWLRDLAKQWARWRLTTGIGASSVATGVRTLSRFGQFLVSIRVDRLARVDRQVVERYLAHLHAEYAGRVVHTHHIGQLNSFFLAIRQHGWDDTLQPSALLFPDDFPRRTARLPRALSEVVMTQLEQPVNLDRWRDPAHRLTTLILMRCGLRIIDAIGLPHDCIVRDADGAPYLRYLNHKMKREALVPIDEELEGEIRAHKERLRDRWPQGTPVLFPRPMKNADGREVSVSDVYRKALYRWLKRCDVRDEHGNPVKVTPHQFRHTLGTRLINRDVPQEVIRRILDHDSHMMTAHYARLSDTTIRRHWEAARKVDASGAEVTLDPDGPLADAAWSKQRLGRVTQALPNGFCGLPVQKTCPHANACLTCPMFVTTTEFLPQHREHCTQVLHIISAAEVRGQQRLVEMNTQVLDNLDRIIDSLDDDHDAHPPTEPTGAGNAS